MKIQFVCASFALAFLLSCSGESLPSGDNKAETAFTEDAKPLLKTQITSTRIDIKEAINLAEEATAFLDKNLPSKSGSNRAVGSVSVLRFGDTKASALKSGKYGDIEISDTLAYVVNFKDSLGYAIISNDIRVESPLFALTEKGTLVNGETDNPGLIIFLERLEGYVLESLIKFGKADEQKLMAAAIGSVSLSFLQDSRNYQLAGPLVPVKWGQGVPFNENVKYDNCFGFGTANNGRTWAGCVATAAAQIMSYWKYPTALGGTSYDWNMLNSYKDSSYFSPSPGDDAATGRQKKRARLAVASLFEKIGAGVNMKYGCEVSNSHGLYALDFLLSNGFHGNLSLGDYSFEYVTLMASVVPLLAQGCRILNIGCHAWVIDGYLSTPTISLVHNNWGWDGTDNGFYNSGVFNPPSKPSPYKNVAVGAAYRYASEW